MNFPHPHPTPLATQTKPLRLVPRVTNVQEKKRKKKRNQ